MKKSVLILSCSLFFILLKSQEISFELFSYIPGKYITEIVHAGDNRLFGANKIGTIEIFNANGDMNSQSFLDITDIVNSECLLCESGLLGLAFHPDYSENGLFFVYYTDADLNKVVAKYSVSENPDIANPYGNVILTIPANSNLHYGGKIAFDSNGFLWIASGTGGNPWLAQDLNSLIGKILRIDVNAETYTIPPDNPFIGVEGTRAEIWAYGLRNPWKFSFDDLTNEVWIADVGDYYEELNRQSQNISGTNYGYPCYSGNAPFLECKSMGNLTFPFYQYALDEGGQAIVGGYIYRSNEESSLYGKYIFSNYVGPLGILDMNRNASFIEIPSSIFWIWAFGESYNKQLYFSGTNRIYKILDNTMSINECDYLELKLFPNPVIDELIIQSNRQVDEVSIYNIDGKLLTSFTGNTDKINFANYPNGVYFVTLTIGKVSKTQKVIKK